MNKKLIFIGLLVVGGLYAYSQSQKETTPAISSVPYAAYEGHFVNAPDGSVLVVDGKLYPVTQALVERYAGTFQHLNITENFWTLYANNPLYMGTDTTYLI